MAKYYALVCISIILVVVWMFVGLGDHSPYHEKTLMLPLPHAYDDPQTPVGDIAITAYYFVPANKIQDASDDSWKLPLAAALDDLKRFHELQFSGTSHITYALHPDPIIGKQDNTTYDGDSTDHGNPNALQTIADEIARSDPSQPQPGIYRVTYIIYDGVGASGMRVDDKHAALLNKRFLTDSQYEDIRETLVAHEFYHTLGIPDGYNISTGTSTTPDIMGLGRSTQTLDANYLDRTTLAHLGL